MTKRLTLTQKVLFGGWLAGSLISLGLVLTEPNSKYIAPVVAATLTSAELAMIDTKYRMDKHKKLNYQ